MPAKHDIEIRVRYQETDGQGVLHHANYFTYFEMGRVELLRWLGHSYRDFEETGLRMVVVRIECKYLRPARYDDLLRLETKISRVTPARIDHAYRLYRDQELLAEAASTLACVDSDGTIQRVPDWLADE